MLHIILIFAVLTYGSAKATTQVEAPLSSDFLNRVQPLIQKCADETKVPTNTFNKMLQGIIENEGSLDFASCYLKGSELVDNVGHVNINNILSLLKEEHPKDKIKKVFEDCNLSSGKDHLETVRLMINCYKENSPVIFTANVKK